MAKEYNSKGKNEVIAYLKAHNEHRLTVAEILDGLKEEGISINRSTIYRNLDRLVESGDILAFKGKDNESAFYQYSGEHKECNAIPVGKYSIWSMALCMILWNACVKSVGWNWMCLRQCLWVLVRNVWQRTESPNNMKNKAWLIVIWAMSFFRF